LTTPPRSLDLQREEFADRRFLAMPIAGAIAWAVVGIGSPFLSTFWACMLIFAATGLIAYLGMFISRFTGENFLDRSRPKNAFDALFFHGVGQAILVYSIAIPFFIVDPKSLPLTVGILTGLMWVPFSWIVRHWVGLFHSASRTAIVVALWYLLPQHRFVAIPFAIVAIYAVTIIVLENRWRARHRRAA
jgi:hypothetical protein